MHPDVLGASRKEVHYFDLHSRESVDWYRSFFDATAKDNPAKIGIEATPYYLYHPAVPARVKALIPDCRVIAILRDPVERAWSGYLHARQHGFECLDFDAALDAEEDRLGDAEQRLLTDPQYVSTEHRLHSYKDRGLYAKQLSRWLEHFSSDQILVIKAEDFYSEPGPVMQRTLAFLGLEGTIEVHRAWSHSIPDKPPIPAAARERLREFFEKPNAELRLLAGAHFDWR